MQKTKKRKGFKGDSIGGKNNKDGNWKKRFKKALKSDTGLKSVMSLLAEEEKNNTAFVAALQTTFAPAPLPPAPIMLCSCYCSCRRYRFYRCLCSKGRQTLKSSDDHTRLSS